MSQALKRQRLGSNEGYEAETSTKKSNLPITLADEELKRKVKHIVRYALACEYKKVIIRKDDINKKILQEHSRQFNVLFKEAKDQLLEIFGMTLLEIPGREKISKGKSIQTQQANSSQQQASQLKPQPSYSYILYNCLNKELGAYQVLHKTEEEYASMGLLYFILSIIFVNEQELGEGELQCYLDKAGLKPQSTAFDDMEKMLAVYAKQGYLHRAKEANEEESTYQWGPRSKTEISSKDLAKFMSSIYGSDANTELEETILKSAGN